VREAAEPR